MPPANIESDPFFELLTDALRAGPGSPKWQEAVDTLRRQGSNGNDEYKLLIEARENLESGRDYRSVRPGQGFTRKLMSEIENASAAGPRKPIPTATIVAVVCGLLIVGVIGYLGWKLTPHDVTTATAQQIDALETKSHGFLDTAATAAFAGALPDGWQVIGSLPLDMTNGLRPSAEADKGKNLGGGVRWTKPLEPAQAFAAEVSVNAPEPTSAILLEAFVSADSNFSADKGTSSHDLVWQLGADQRVLLSGSSQPLTSKAAFHNGDMVRLIVDQNVAIIEVVSSVDGKTQRLWAGPHDLGKTPRYVGVRFLQTGAAGKADVSVKSIKITTAPG